MVNTAVLHMTGGSKGSLRKKLLLWLLLVVQLCFIFCFWIIQTGFQDHGAGETHERRINGNKPEPEMLHFSAQDFKGVLVGPAKNRVNFVTKLRNVAETKEKSIDIVEKNDEMENVNHFKRDYLELNTYRLMNITGIEAEILIEQPDLGIANRVWCFRDGTVNATTETMLYWNIETQRPQCKCRQYWHGKDCGQPEVIWRALMLPGKQFKLREPDEHLPPHRLIYMLEGYFFSLDLLELQIEAVKDVVDYFLIYCDSKHVNTASVRAMRKRLNELLSPERYMLYHCRQRDERKVKVACNTPEAFEYFKEKLKVKLKKPLLTTDLFLYSNENAIYSQEPLKFLKYYATPEMSLWRFRLKYNVFGFYWQHPSRTHLSGFICSFYYLENSSKLKNLLATLNGTNGAGGANILGDLNHYGGWFCQYCQHPDDIIKELLELPIDSSSHKQFNLPKGTKNRFIDSKYIENLIAQGTHIDGKTRLEKIRQYNDKHFAPTYAENCKWKYGNILTNLFEAMDNDYIIEEAEGGAGF